MGELRRLLTSRKYIFTVILLIVANVVLFQISNVEKLKQMGSEEQIKQFVTEYKEINELNVSAYYECVDNIEANAEELSSVGIFANVNSFAKRNIDKTVEDYSRIKNVKVDNIFGVAADSIFEYKAVHMAVLIHMLILILMFFEERKNGLWNVIHSCKNGRAYMSARRLVSLAICNILFVCAAYVSVILTSLIDFDSFYILSKPVQCISAFQNFTLPMSIGGFLVYYVAWQVVAAVLMSLIVWLVLSVIHNRTYAFVVLAALFLTGYYMTGKITDQSPAAVLRYANLYFLYDATPVYSVYSNFKCGSFIFNSREFLHMLCSVLIPVLSVLCIAINACVRPVYQVGFIERTFVKLNEILHSRIRVLHGFGYEVYKYLISHKGIYVLIVVAYISYHGMGLNKLTRSPYYTELKEFYKEYSGPIDEEGISVYEEKFKNVELADKELFEAIKNYNDGVIDEILYADAIMYNKSFESDRKITEELGKVIDNKELIESKGVEAWFVDTDGVKHLVGGISKEKRMINNIMAAFVVILLFMIFDYREKKSDVKYIIRSCKKGRRHHNVMILCASLCISFVVCSIIFGMEAYDVWYSYGFGDLRAPIQNVDEFLNFPLHISMGTYVVLWYAGRYLLITGTGLILRFLEERRVRN